MKLRHAWRLSLVLALVGAATAVADGDLGAVYRAILQGDYDRGQVELSRLMADNSVDPRVGSVNSWLKSFSDLSTSREELIDKTRAWNLEQARQALNDPEKVFLALSFASQAMQYLPHSGRLPEEPWLRELRAKAEDAASRYEKEGRWSKAHAYYLQLERIFPDDEEIKAHRDQLARHARLEALYEDKKAVERRIEGVDFTLIQQAIRRIDQNYYREPDFKAMAEGALESLLSVCSTKKLYDVFDGVANPVLREHFTAKVEQERQELARKERFSSRNLLDLFKRMCDENEKTIELPRALLLIEMMEGATAKLDDFTSVVWPADSDDFDKVMVGGFHGVGIQLGVDEVTNRLQVVTPLEDSPALEAGIQPGDLIDEVDGKTTKGWSTDDAVRNITGPAGTKVLLTMFRPGSGERLNFELTRRRIQLRTVRGLERKPNTSDGWNYMLDPGAGIGYIRLTGFNPDSQNELNEALETAREQGMKALILDLRYNPGGLLEVAISTVSTFLKTGRVVETRGRTEERQQLDVLGSAAFADLPLVVLVNDASASASEILAGALQDQNRAVVVGERTFGKGSVQRVLPLGARTKARLKLTTALYYLPSGRSPHKLPEAENWGVDPDWEIELTPKEIVKVIERQNNAYVIHNEKTDAQKLDDAERDEALAQLKDDGNGKDKDDDKPLLSEDDIKLLRSDPCKAPDSDPQLEKALLHLRVKLAGDLPWPRQVAAQAAEVKQP
jgi:carboxyl-terminal processing protease